MSESPYKYLEKHFTQEDICFIWLWELSLSFLSSYHLQWYLETNEGSSAPLSVCSQRRPFARTICFLYIFLFLHKLSFFFFSGKKKGGGCCKLWLTEFVWKVAGAHGKHQAIIMSTCYFFYGVHSFLIWFLQNVLAPLLYHSFYWETLSCYVCTFVLAASLGVWGIFVDQTWYECRWHSSTSYTFKESIKQKLFYLCLLLLTTQKLIFIPNMFRMYFK